MADSDDGDMAVTLQAKVREILKKMCKIGGNCRSSVSSPPESANEWMSILDVLHGAPGDVHVDHHVDRRHRCRHWSPVDLCGPLVDPPCGPQVCVHVCVHGGHRRQDLPSGRLAVLPQRHHVEVCLPQACHVPVSRQDGPVVLLCGPQVCRRYRCLVCDVPVSWPLDLSSADSPDCHPVPEAPDFLESSYHLLGIVFHGGVLPNVDVHLAHRPVVEHWQRTIIIHQPKKSSLGLYSLKRNLITNSAMSQTVVNYNSVGPTWYNVIEWALSLSLRDLEFVSCSAETAASQPKN